MEELTKKDAFVKSTDAGAKLTVVEKPVPKIGVDTSNSIMDNIIYAGESGSIDFSTIQSLTNVSQSREQIYQLLDSMAQDSAVSAILETYAEDATEYNDEGRIIWAEASDDAVSSAVTYILDCMNVDKHAYSWAYKLCKYGDLYLKLFRESDYGDDNIFAKKKDEDNTLNEDVKVYARQKGDMYAYYLEAMPNPAEMFELTRFGVTEGYIKADVNSYQQTANTSTLAAQQWQWKFKTNDIGIYQADDFVHAYLEDNSSRIPEEVKLFRVEDDEETKGMSYTVRRGQSILYNTFKIWREKSLLENSVLMNRVTKSATLRIAKVNVPDMPKEQIKSTLQGVKMLMEQKSAIQAGTGINEYTNPGPMENTIYIPVKGEVGAVSIDTVGGEVEVNGLKDLEYFQDLFYGSLRVPKQYFGVVGDNAGFSGGESLALISSRYAKTVKRIQNSLIQAITDAINLILINKGLTSYANKFTIKMQPPTTKEEKERRESVSSKLGFVRDVMQELGDIQVPSIKLTIIKSLLSNVITDSEVISLIQKQIDLLEEEENGNAQSEGGEDAFGSEEPMFGGGGPSAGNEDVFGDLGGEESLPSPSELGAEGPALEEPSGNEQPTSGPASGGAEEGFTHNDGEILMEDEEEEELLDRLPSASELNIDMTVNK